MTGCSDVYYTSVEHSHKPYNGHYIAKTHRLYAGRATSQCQDGRIQLHNEELPCRHYQDLPLARPIAAASNNF